jgi:1-acyl-sn-glycerol-3-phosphate acyltransferase
MKLYAVFPSLLQKVLQPIIGGYLRHFHGLTVLGSEFVQAVSGPVIVVANHPSQLDVFVIATALKMAAPEHSIHNPIFFVSHEKPYYGYLKWKRFFYGGVLFRIAGGFPVYTGLRDCSKSFRHHLEIISDGYSVCIFPEEDRPNGTILVHSGVSHLCEISGAPMLPARVIYGYNTISVYFGAHISSEVFYLLENGSRHTPHKRRTELLMRRIYALGKHEPPRPDA